MKKIGTITFHASYNHGSCLQAYALQTFVKEISNGNCDYEIINLRTDKQKEIYKTAFERTGFKNILKRMFLIRHKKQFENRSKNYEKFIAEKLNITKEYLTLTELKLAKFNYDYYISGSDQLWNLNCHDFDWANYLEFTDSANKISYAASFGPIKQNWSNSEAKRIKSDLDKYSHISVREVGSAKNIYKLLGQKPEINIDPTLLLKKEEWNKLIDRRLIKKDYIFLYDVKGLIDARNIAKYLSKKMKMPVVVVREKKLFYVSNCFIKKYDAGPLEFLNYVKYSKLVLSSSFHGTVFSVIFQKPFYAINGKTDFRINNLLELTGLEQRCLTVDEVRALKPTEILDIDFEHSERVIEMERSKSKKYLEEALELSGGRNE